MEEFEDDSLPLIKIPLIAEIRAVDMYGAQCRLDAFREAVFPGSDWPIRLVQSDGDTCSNCWGTGIRRDRSALQATSASDLKCPTCGGSGEIKRNVGG